MKHRPPSTAHGQGYRDTSYSTTVSWGLHLRRSTHHKDVTVKVEINKLQNGETVFKSVPHRVIKCFQFFLPSSLFYQPLDQCQEKAKGKQSTYQETCCQGVFFPCMNRQVLNHDFIFYLNPCYYYSFYKLFGSC